MMKKAYKIGKQIRLLRLNQKKTAFYRNAVFMMPGEIFKQEYCTGN